MTTITYRDGILAADSQGTHAGTRYPGSARKIDRREFHDANGVRRTHLAAAGGAASDVRRFLQWFTDGEHGEFKAGIEAEEDRGFVGVVVVGLTELRIYDRYGWNEFHLPQGEYYATGSGSDYALGAMAAGKDAFNAILAAAKHDIYTDSNVKMESLT